MKNARVNFSIEIIISIAIILGIIFVSAISPTWVGSNVNYSIIEDLVYYHNLSENITGFNNDVDFAIDTTEGRKIYWTDNSGRNEATKDFISSWINITNSLEGNLTIYALHDNQTGFFEIPIQAKNITDDEGTTTIFEFIINATNDFPEFDLQENYTFNVNVLENVSENITISGEDEEEHYPLVFHNITFFDNCEPAGWSTRGNCEFDFENESISNQTILINFTNLSYNDVGIYPVQICINDTLPPSEDRPLYRTENYNENKTTCHNTTLIIQSILSVNVSNCTESNFTENKSGVCYINITTTGQTDQVNISSYAFLRNSISSYAENRSWFIANQTKNAENFTITLEVNVTPQKTEIGNWTINFSVNDSVSDLLTEPIYIFVNRNESLNDAPELSANKYDLNTSINLLYTFYLNVTDDDLKIPDKEVYNETLNLNFTNITKDSTSFSNNENLFNITNQQYNYTDGFLTAELKFYANSTQHGIYILNLSVNDSDGYSDYKIFTINISNNTAPYWNVTNNIIYLNTSNISASETGFNFYLNLTNSSNEYFWANDSDDGDVLSFSNSSGAPPRFNLTSEGIINFTPWKEDVGVWVFNLTAADNLSLTNSTQITFNISNNNSAPFVYSLTGDNTTPSSIDLGSVANISADDLVSLSLLIKDNDSLITSGYYNESLSVEISLENLSVVNENVSISNFTLEGTAEQGISIYSLNFTAVNTNAGLYNFTINITDAGGLSDLFYFTLNISEINHNPEINTISNYSNLTIYNSFYLELNATDEDEDDENLIFNVNNLTQGLNISDYFNSTTREINISNLTNYSGIHEINVSVEDSLGAVAWQVFTISIYDFANLTSPNEDSVFYFTEATEGNFTFEFNHSVGDNLTLEIWTDFISCEFNDSSNCSYSNFSNRENKTSYGNGTEFNISWTPEYYDETYTNLKNLTIKVYPQNNELSQEQKESIAGNFSFKLNINHTNQNLSFSGNIQNQSAVKGTPININLSDYFSDEDYFDSFYRQEVNFSVEGNSTISSSFSNWTLTLSSATAVTETMNITGREYNSTNHLIKNATSNNFTIEFTESEQTPTPTPQSSSGGGSATLLKLFAIRIIVPQDIIISNQNFIEIPFMLKNTGEVDLKGINLTSSVLFNNMYSDDIKIFMEPVYFEELKIGESKNLSMKIIANTQKEGRYKATVHAEVSSPKFSDWGDFFIDLRRVEETEAEKIIIFTEKLIAENPECMELTEILKRAKEKLAEGDEETAIETAREAVQACEEAIKTNEQIRFKLKNILGKNFYYLFSAILSVFLIGFIVYIYKRVRFNK